MRDDAPARKLSVMTLAALAAAGSALAQQALPADPVRASSQVSVVNVEVVVTDRDGKPVTDLTAADFEVTEDGKPQAITNFLAGSWPAASTSEKEASQAPRASAGEIVSVILFVDNANLVPAQRDEVLKRIQALMKGGWPGAGVQMMLASGSRAVHVVQPLTADPTRLAEGMDKLSRETAGAGGGGVSSFMNQVMESSPGDSGSSDFAAQDRQSQLDNARSAAQEAYERSRSYLAAQSQFVDSLAWIPGRKIVLYLSDGLQTRPGEAVLQRFEAKYGGSVETGFSAASESTRYSLTHELRTFLQRANSSRLTFFCIPGSGGGGVSSGADQRHMERDASIGAGESMNQQQALSSLAQATGGRVLPNNDAVGASISRVVDDVRNAYLLGYSNPHPDAGTYHTLQVRVKRDGVVVRHREGYLNKTPDDRMAERALAGVLAESTSNPLDVSVSLRSATPEKDGVFSAVVLAIIPLGNVLLQPKGDVHEGQLSLWIAVRNREGSITQGAKQVFPLRVPNDRLLSAQGQSVGYTFQLRLREGEYRVAVAVRDDVGQIDSTAFGAIQIGALQPAEAGK